MRTTDEMIHAVHERVTVIRRRQENRRIAIAGSGCTMLFFLLSFLVISRGGVQHQIQSSEYSGASLLADDVGGYVLVALAAFMAGAAIVAVLRTKRRNGRKDNNGEE